jgi:hypothetical protein
MIKGNKGTALAAKFAMLTIAIAGLSACVVEAPPQYSYDPNYPPSRDNHSAYSGDYDQFNDERNADERNGWGHSDDRNFHNRDDYQQYDR